MFSLLVRVLFHFKQNTISMMMRLSFKSKEKYAYMPSISENNKTEHCNAPFHLCHTDRMYITNSTEVIIRSSVGGSVIIQAVKREPYVVRLSGLDVCGLPQFLFPLTTVQKIRFLYDIKSFLYIRGNRSSRYSESPLLRQAGLWETRGSW